MLKGRAIALAFEWTTLQSWVSLMTPLESTAGMDRWFEWATVNGYESHLGSM